MRFLLSLFGEVSEQGGGAFLDVTGIHISFDNIEYEYVYEMVWDDRSSMHARIKSLLLLQADDD